MEGDIPSDGSPMKLETSKKRKRYGRMSEVRKKLNLSSHTMGEDCQCTLKCFEKVPEATRNSILKEFNLLNSVDMQNSYLCGLISVLPIQRRRPRNAENAQQNNASYKYRVRVNINGTVEDTVICRKAFIAFHGITKGKVEYLVSSLRSSGQSPLDKRGKHDNRPWRLSDVTRNSIKAHIASFPRRGSHYGLKDSKKTYLSEELNTTKMYNLFKEAYPSVKVSYQCYREIFSSEFNISFGYPRTDTCSTCDEFSAKVKVLENDKKHITDKNCLTKINKEIERLHVENQVHKRKASALYNKKKDAKEFSKTHADYEAIAFDFGKNLSLPNIPTNDVYYKRQLSVYNFNVHILASRKSVFFIYPECSGKKGSDDVCSMLHKFVYDELDERVRKLEVFCDGCSGQNKNYTLVRFFHNLVHTERRFDLITASFPVRGHSYLETDKNLGLINQKTRTELPHDWIEVFETARTNPSPFIVHEATIDTFRQWTAHLAPFYKKKCPFATRPVREIVFEINLKKEVKFRTSFNGAFELASITTMDLPPHGKNEGEFNLPNFSYEGLLPIPLAKYQDLQALKKFCGPQAQEYYGSLPHE